MDVKEGRRERGYRGTLDDKQERKKRDYMWKRAKIGKKSNMGQKEELLGLNVLKPGGIKELKKYVGQLSRGRKKLWEKFPCWGGGKAFEAKRWRVKI